MFRFLFLANLLALFVIPQTIKAQSRIKISSDKRIYLEYQSKSWNRNPNEVNNGALILRDGITKKMARIELFETDIDSGLFRGQYVLNWGEAEMAPEVYLPPVGLGKTNDQMVKIESSIENGTLLRKPFFIRSNNRNFQTLTVYDTKDQAIKAYDDYVKLYGAGKKVPDPAAVEAQVHQQKQKEIREQEIKAAEQQRERLNLEQQEKKNREELLAKQQAMSQKERDLKKQQASNLAAEGFSLYKEKKYKEAEEKFSKAIELDPENGSFYFQYGVTLYKNQKYQKAIALLKIADGSAEVNEVERQYYLGMSYLKIKDFDKALHEFSAVKAYQDKDLSPSAAFFSGIINYQKENYDTAKADFESVLDSSSDPAMDKEAETYIEQIANVMAFKKEQEKKFLIALNLSLIYDSNILLTQNSVAGSGSPSDLAGYRWGYGGTFTYRPVYTYTQEFAVNLYINDMYSTDNKFSAKKEFQDTDPLVMGISMPFKSKTQAFGKAYQGTLTPGYETTTMNADGTGAREVILNSTFLRLDNTLVMSENLFSTYSLEYRNNKSLLSATGDDDQNGTKYTLSSNQVLFRDAKKTQAWLFDLGFAQNNAAGNNYKVFRYDLGVGYMAPWIWETVWSGKISYYDENYGSHTTGRRDKDTTLLTTLTKPLSATLSGTLMGIYTINSSTLDSSDYKKYMIMTTLNWSTSL